jgi:hypothetical protein
MECSRNLGKFLSSALLFLTQFEAHLGLEFFFEVSDFHCSEVGHSDPLTEC